ncbi:MAG TPA: TIGR04255 family protein [Acidiferrobacterales bacterium]|nr:TIGR04255 family protein [Acidiferrobacterales bacterium]
MNGRVDFKSPPVVEVICGVLFSTAKPIRAAHIGAFWNSVRTDFPATQEVPPLPPVLEETGGMSFQFQISTSPEIPRTWFVTEDGRQIIQMQPDRFLLNWKKAAQEDEYPRFEFVIEQFEGRFQAFTSFVDREKLGPITFRQFELTYVNLIDKHNGLDEVKKHEVLVDHTREVGRNRFLPEPDAFNWSTSYPLPDGAGRLHLVTQTTLSGLTQEQAVRIDLIARGIFKDKPDEVRKWFDLAHIWIINGFADATNPLLQKKSWHRTT